MSTIADEKAAQAAEGFHALCLAAAAAALLLGLATSQSAWVKGGISLVILLPPLRLATTILGEARARRYAVAAMGVLVLAFLLLSRRIS